MAGSPVRRDRAGAAGDLDNGGPGLEIWAQLSLALRDLAGQLAEHNDHLRRARKLNEAFHQVPIACPLLAPGGTVDVPDQLGPRHGWAWDVHRITLAPADLSAPWTGHAYLFDGSPSPSSLIDVFTGTDEHLWTHWYGSPALLLTARQRLVLVAGADFTGAAVPGGVATQVTAERVAEYLK